MNSSISDRCSPSCWCRIFEDDSKAGLRSFFRQPLLGYADFPFRRHFYPLLRLVRIVWRKLPRSWRANPAVRRWADPLVLKLDFEDHADFPLRRHIYALPQSFRIVWRRLSRSWRASPAARRWYDLLAPLLMSQDRPIIRVDPLGDCGEVVDPFATNNTLFSRPTLKAIQPPAPIGVPSPGGVPPPIVSVIIAAHNGLALTLDCLAAIAAAVPRMATEVIVIDDASSDNTQIELSGRRDIRYIRNRQNLGFLDSCNIGAAAARGRHLMFLNNDTVVTPGSLDVLAETLERDSRIGIVGGKLLFPNGRLQEAGAITWADAAGSNWGRGQDPNDPRFRFSRPVDYVSGCAMMMPKSLFMAVGGFDLRFRPAYYEDTDIAFEVRALGLDVVYQPNCRIVHHESMSYGRESRSSKISHMERNRLHFRQKWSAVLPQHGSNNAPPRNFADRKPVGRALIIDTSTPTPDRDSGSLDMINLMRILIEFGYRVTFVPEDNFRRFGAYTEKLENMGIECICAPYETSVHGLVTKRGDIFDLIVLSRRDVAARHIKTVRKACPSARVVFNLVDLHYLREERAAVLEGMSGNKTVNSDAKNLELNLASEANAAITVSSFEADLLRRERPTARVVTIPVIRNISGRAGGVAGRRDILFIGGFDHPPNGDAVAWFVTDILPRIRRDLNDIRFHIVGSNMPASIACLGVSPDRKGPVLIHGHVEDLAPLFATIRLTVAPLRYGAGIKGKVATSLCYGVPCVATTIAVEGSNLVPGKDILVADDAEEFAQAVVQLCHDDALWDALSDAGLATADQQFSLRANRDRAARLLADIQAPPFFGKCPACGQHVSFDPGLHGRNWKSPICSGCGADAPQRAIAIAVMSCLGFNRPKSAFSARRDTASRLLVIDVAEPLRAMLARLGERVVEGTAPGEEQPVAGIILGRIVHVDMLVTLRARLRSTGWMVIGDPRPEDTSPAEFGLARRELFLAAGLKANRALSPAGTGLVEAMAWVARPITDHH